MARTDSLLATVGCPACDADVTAALPAEPASGADVTLGTGPDLGVAGAPDGARLRGTETTCGNCGHAVDVYYY